MPGAINRFIMDFLSQRSAQQRVERKNSSGLSFVPVSWLSRAGAASTAKIIPTSCGKTTADVVMWEMNGLKPIARSSVFNPGFEYGIAQLKPRDVPGVSVSYWVFNVHR